MAKYFGSVGFVETVEISPGVWVEQPTERTYFGEVNRNSRRIQPSNNLNDNVVISNEISIVADPFAYENFHAIRYATFMGAKWKVSSIDVQRPRMTLTLEGVYNG